MTIVLSNVDYDTFDELSFLNGVGTWRCEEADKLVPLSWRVEVLKGYIRGAQLRTDWQDIDRERVLERARELLALAGAAERRAG